MLTMKLVLVKLSFKLFLFLCYTDTIYSCKNAKHRPNIPHVKKSVWKAYTNKTLEMEIFSGIEKETILPVNVTLEIDSEMKLSQHNVSEAPIKFSFQLLQKMPLYHLSSPQFSGSVLRKTGRHVQKMLMEMDFEIDEHFKLLSYCTRLSSSNVCIASHTLTWGSKDQRQEDLQKNFLSFFVVLDFRQQNIHLCVANNKNKHAMHCYNHLNGLNNVKDFYLNGDILLMVNRTEACMKRMKFNSVSYINHQLVQKNLNSNRMDSHDSSNVVPFVSKARQIENSLKSTNHQPPNNDICDNDSNFCEFTKPHYCLNKTHQCQNNNKTLFTWNHLHPSDTIKLNPFEVHKIRNFSLSFGSTTGFIGFTSMSGMLLDGIYIDPILDAFNVSTNRFSVRYENQTSQLLFSSSSGGIIEPNSQSVFWIYIEFPEDVGNMCLLKENAKIFVSTENQLSFLGYAVHSPRYWYSIRVHGVKQMRMGLQNHAEVPTPVLFPVYSSIPVYSRSVETSNLDITNISFDNCRRIQWAHEKAQTEVVLSSAIPIIIIIIFVVLCLVISYKLLKKRYYGVDTNSVTNVPTKKVSLETVCNEGVAEKLTNESRYYKKRRTMNYKDQIEHTNVKSFITMEG